MIALDNQPFSITEDEGFIALMAHLEPRYIIPSKNITMQRNKAGYTATLVACGWAGAVLEKVTRASGQEPYAQKAQKRRKSKKGTDQPTDRPTNRPTDRPTDIT